MKTKLHLYASILLWIKWTGMVEIRNKDFINSLQIMGLIIFGDHRFGDSHEFTGYDRFFGQDLQ